MTETDIAPEWYGLATAIGLGTLLAYTIFEFVFILITRKDLPFKLEFLQPLKNFMLVAIIGQGLRFGAMWFTTAGLAIIGTQLTPFHLPDHWSKWAIGLVIYEFWYWVQHWAGHKVRLFWCIHAPHHAPKTINMIAGLNHHFLESLIYFPVFFGFMNAICGVPVEVILVITAIDGLWGSFLHISPAVVKGKYGPLEYFMQTPSYHRVHHGRNVRYMDTNYNSITLLWDWIMGTRQPLLDDDPVDYGITREVDTTSLMDVQFGEFTALWRDVKSAPGIANKIRYMIMPPGWSHTGDHKTATVQKAAHQTSLAE